MLGMNGRWEVVYGYVGNWEADIARGLKVMHGGI